MSSASIDLMRETAFAWKCGQVSGSWKQPSRTKEKIGGEGTFFSQSADKNLIKLAIPQGTKLIKSSLGGSGGGLLCRASPLVRTSSLSRLLMSFLSGDSHKQDASRLLSVRGTYGSVSRFH